MISGFSFIHNALNGGYPIFEAIEAVQPFVDEIVIVDMESNDGTRELLERMPGVRVEKGLWIRDQDENVLDLAHAMHTIYCKGDVILHFEGDEVFERRLVEHLVTLIRRGGHDQIAVQRVQVEQNFQRVRWWPGPYPVHRVFKNGSVTKKGHTTDLHDITHLVSGNNGFLWDVTNCFRDNWLGRINQQAEIWHQPNMRMVRYHANLGFDVVGDLQAFLAQDYWTWKETPLAVPAILRTLLGVTDYREYCRARR